MQPRSHAFVIRAAVAASCDPWLLRHQSDVLRGNDDEDVWLLGPLRLRAPGLSHTYRPGHARGELGAPSAKARLLACVARARAEVCDPLAARWLGRASHLLADMAVPARTRGVWHLLGDPLELYWEQVELEALLASSAPSVVAASEPGELSDSLAGASSAFSADPTRTPWGALARWCGRRRRLDADEIAAQARALLPLAVAHTRALLEGEAGRRRSAALFHMPSK